MSINLENENDINNTNVFCRFRPMTKKELEFSSEQISPMIPTTTLNINTSKEKIFSVLTLTRYFHLIQLSKKFMKIVLKNQLKIF